MKLREPAYSIWQKHRHAVERLLKLRALGAARRQPEQHGL